MTFSAPESTPEVTPEATPEVMRLLRHLTGEMSRVDLQDAMGLRDAEHFRTSYLNPGLVIKAIERTIPEKPTSSNQKFRITAIGEQILASFNDTYEV